MERKILELFLKKRTEKKVIKQNEILVVSQIAIGVFIGKAIFSILEYFKIII